MKARTHRRSTPEQPPERSALFDLLPNDDTDPADPAALARAATQASERAMKGRRWNEAKALAGLAESYARLGERARGGGQTIETMDLRLLHEVLTDDSGAAAARMAMKADRHNDPDRVLKEDYHDRRSAHYQATMHHQMAMLRRVHAAERQVKALGGEVVVTQAGFDEVADARAWLIDEALALDEVTVTPSPPPGDPWTVGL